ncbi:hypothetical protein [Streptomyces lienomycini]|uniref:Uncharacterized protein n=1 Tax=Streptomyces lienomycini TaxID=284035 RepID=A0ABV9WQF6_9ACTN|nr:hypothetical protein [Streptomyces lienomycini]
MTASGPGGGAAPDEPDGTPSVPEYVWRLFLEDDERAIRASAPREPAARDRIPGRPPEPPSAVAPPPADADRAGPPRARTGRPGRPGHPGRPGLASDTVGEAWRPEDPGAGPSWRELDGRARLRRIGRVVGTAAAVALALTAWSQLSTDPVAPDGGPAETIGQRLEESPALPPPASPAPTQSAAASTAVFEPAPSAIPRASVSPRTAGSPGTGDSPWTADAPWTFD